MGRKAKFDGKKNGDCKSVELNLNKRGTVHTNPDGKKIKVKVVGDEYFSKRIKGLKGSLEGKGGSAGLHANHLEFNGYLHFNNLALVDIDEIDEKWS